MELTNFKLTKTKNHEFQVFMLFTQSNSFQINKRFYAAQKVRISTFQNKKYIMADPLLKTFNANILTLIITICKSLEGTQVRQCVSQETKGWFV